MEDCIEYRDRISALLDDALPEQEQQGLLDHLERCSACQAYLDDQLVIRAALAALEADAPADLADAVMAQVRQTPQVRPAKRGTRFSHWRRWAAAAACCALALLGAVGWGHRAAPLSAQDVGSMARMPEEVSIHATEAEAPLTFAALPAEAAAPCVLTTASDLARQWVGDTLGTDAETAEGWSLTPEQLTQLRAVLDDAGERYTCAAADSGWLVVLEP